MSWATPAQALTITRKTVTQAQLDEAYQIVEIEVGFTTDALTYLKPRDLRLLRQAESYQAVWMAAQVDYYERSDSDLASQDGMQWSKGDPDMHVLAPLAARCLRKLSRRRTRSLEPLTPAQALVLRGVRTPETYGVDTDEIGSFGDDSEWRPL